MPRPLKLDPLDLGFRALDALLKLQQTSYASADLRTATRVVSDIVHKATQERMQNEAQASQ